MLRLTQVTARLNRLKKVEQGAIDLASIMTGLIVIGLIGGVIAATVFAVIPWTQDQAAKASVSSIVTAESAYAGLNTDPGLVVGSLVKSAPADTSGVKYASLKELNDSKLLTTVQAKSGSETVSDDGRVCVIGGIGDYQIWVKSLSGNNTYFTSLMKPGTVNQNHPNYAIPDASCVGFGSSVPGEEDPEETPQVIEAYTNELIVGWASHDLSTVPSDEAALGVQNGMLSAYVDFASEKAFPQDYMSMAKDRDAALLIAWEPYDMYNSSLNQSEFKPTRVTAGDFDTYMTDWLTEAQVHAKNNTVMVRFAPEMNDAIRPWSVSTNGGNTAAEYVAMWKHVYDMKQAIAPDVIFVWTPLVDGSDLSGNPVSFDSVFPGVNYVDMLALDGFNWADVQNPGTCGWQSYGDVFAAPVAKIKSLSGGKPWGIAETASVSRDASFFAEGGPCYDGWGSWVYDWPESGEFYQTPEDWVTQAGWTKTMIQQAQADGALFVNLFNTNKETDWRLQSTPAGATVLSDLNAGTSPYTFGGENPAGFIKGAVNP